MSNKETPKPPVIPGLLFKPKRLPAAAKPKKPLPNQRSLFPEKPKGNR